MDFKTKIKEHKFPLLLELIKWIIIDIRRLKRFGRPLHFYGIRCVCGMYGQGKSVVLTKIGSDYRKKYGNDIYICSNYGFSLQDFAFEDIEQVSFVYDKPIIFLWDEVQNDFPATDMVFPKDVRKALTLNRKGCGKQFFWCSQDHELVHKTIRRLTIRYGEVRTLFNRYTRVRWYLKEDYENKANEIDVKKKMKIRPIKVDKFVQTDQLRSLFNSYGVDNGEQVVKDNNDNNKYKKKSKLV